MIDHIREYKPYRGIPIARDFNVADEQHVFIGNGIGCHTFWFRDVKDAKKFIDKYYSQIRDVDLKSLIPKSVCEKCQCHYSSFSKEYKKYIPYNCKKWKEMLKKYAGIE